MSYTNLLMTLTDTKATFQSYSPLGNTEAGDKQVSINNFINYLKRMRDGQSYGTLQFSVGATQATSTLTSTGAASDGQAITIQGIALTAAASPGADEWAPSATVGTQATNIANAVNANATLASIMTASAAAGVVTLTANQPGVAGNAFTISENCSNVTLATFASLATGSAGTAVTVTMT